MSPLAILSFAGAHWRGLGAGAALALAFGAGYRTHARLHPPTVCAPAVTEHVDDHAAQKVEATQDTTTHAGPTKKVTIDFDPQPNAHAANAHDITPANLCRPVVVPGLAEPVQVPDGERIESVTVEEDGASETYSRAATEITATEDRHLDLTVRPSATQLPRLELQVGLEDVLRARTLRAAARVRVTERGWLELSARPGEWTAGHKDFGVGLAVSF